MLLNSVAVKALSYITYGFTIRSYSVFVLETFMEIYLKKMAVIFFQNLKSGNNFISFFAGVTHSLLFRGITWNLYGK